MMNNLRLWPTKKQWKSWKLPSRLTAISAYIGVFSLLITISFNVFDISFQKKNLSSIEYVGKQRGSPSPISAKTKASEYYGEIVFKDGSNTNFTDLTFAGIRIFEYRMNLKDKSTRKAQVSAVSKIDLTDLTRHEEYIVRQRYLGAVRKAKIVFSDGGARANVYINVASWRWKNNYEEGNFTDAKSVTIKTTGVN